ncbi:MAG: fibronectin type III-like domain-contianing protein [Candidatus Limnocylindrales bacterium]
MHLHDTVIRLAAGETRELTLALEDRHLAYWDRARHSWRVEPGRYEIGVGRSSRDIRLRRSFDLA